MISYKPLQAYSCWLFLHMHTNNSYIHNNNSIKWKKLIKSSLVSIKISTYIQKRSEFLQRVAEGCITLSACVSKL